MKKNKKGSITDVMITFIFLFVVFIFAGVALFITNTFNDAWQEEVLVPESSKEFSEGYSTNVTTIMDGALVLFFTVLWIVSIVSALYLDSNPIFFIIFAIISVFTVVGIASFGLFIEAIEATALGPSLALMPITSFILKQGIWFSVAYVLSVGAALYFKIGGRQ